MESPCNNNVETIPETNMEETNSRRDTIAQAGLVAGGLMIGSLLGRTKAAHADDMMNNSSMMMPPIATATFGSLLMPKSDVDILNFALILEYLEADFYTRAVQAHATRPYLIGKVPALAQKLRDDENAHVLAIQQRITDLGGTPVGKPTFQFPSETFISPVAFLQFAATLEQTGVGAYLGAAPMIKRGDVLRFAASIFGIETRHTSMIRFAGGYLAAPDALESPLSLNEVAMRVAPLILAPAAMMSGDTMPATTTGAM